MADLAVKREEMVAPYLVGAAKMTIPTLRFGGCRAPSCSISRDARIVVSRARMKRTEIDDLVVSTTQEIRNLLFQIKPSMV